MVATILHSQIEEGQENFKQIPKTSDVYFFSLEKYFEEQTDEFNQQHKTLLHDPPTIDNIYEFINALYEYAQFSPECCIICLVYINRLIAFTNLTLNPTNWRPLLLSSLLVAQKVWDDKYLSNADFAFIYPFFTTIEINKLEAKFLELLQYNVTVKGALYAKYYYELRSIYSRDEYFPLIQLNAQQCAQLEARSQAASIKEKDLVGSVNTYIINVMIKYLYQIATRTHLRYYFSETEQVRKPRVSKLSKQLSQLDIQYNEYMQYYKFEKEDQMIKKKSAYQLYFDGSSRNPGKSGIGAVILNEDNGIVHKLCLPIGHRTNNQAEYMALLFGIRCALDLGIQQLHCFGDSKLVIETMKGSMNIANDELKILNNIANEYTRLFKSVDYQHVMREQNKLADKLSKDSWGG